MYEDKCNKEVIELHDFFLNWFTGKAIESDFIRFSDHISPLFQLITPTATVIDYDGIKNMIKNSYNSRNEMEMWIENVSTWKLSSDIYLTTYHELNMEDGTKTRRLSTAIFRVNEKCVNSVEWVHVHETWVNDK